MSTMFGFTDLGSLIPSMFLIAGLYLGSMTREANGRLTVQPTNKVRWDNSNASFACTSNVKYPKWSYREYTFDSSDSTPVTRDDCVSVQEGYVVEKNAAGGSFVCDITKKTLTLTHPLMFVCTDDAETASAVYLTIDPEVRCSDFDEVLACEITHSTLRFSKIAVLRPVLTWFDPNGALIPGNATRSTPDLRVSEIPKPVDVQFDAKRPYICKATFAWSGPTSQQYRVSNIISVQTGYYDCSYPNVDSDLTKQSESGAEQQRGDEGEASRRTGNIPFNQKVAGLSGGPPRVDISVMFMTSLSFLFVY